MDNKPDDEQTGLTGLFRAYEPKEDVEVFINPPPPAPEGWSSFDLPDGTRGYFPPSDTTDQEYTYTEDDEHTGILPVQDIPERPTFFQEWKQEIKSHPIRVWWIMCVGWAVFSGVILWRTNPVNDPPPVPVVIMSPTGTPSATTTNTPKTYPVYPMTPTRRPTAVPKLSPPSPRVSERPSAVQTPTTRPTPRPTSVKPSATPTKTPTSTPRPTTTPTPRPTAVPTEAVKE